MISHAATKRASLGRSSPHAMGKTAYSLRKNTTYSNATDFMVIKLTGDGVRIRAMRLPFRIANEWSEDPKI